MKRPPNATEVTPSGFEIVYYDSKGVDGEPQQRRYLVNDERYVNVTTATGIFQKEALLGWVAKETEQGRNWRETRDEAGKRGTATHDLIVRLMGEGASLSELPDEQRPYGQAAAKWVLHRSPKTIDSERMVASVVHGYAGRFDLLCEIRNVVTRVDFKTVTSWAYRNDKRLPPFFENVLQLSAYEMAARESGYALSQKLLIVRLGPDGSYDETYVPYVPERFLSALGAYHAKRETERDLRAVA